MVFVCVSCLRQWNRKEDYKKHFSLRMTRLSNNKSFPNPCFNHKPGDPASSVSEAKMVQAMKKSALGMFRRHDQETESRAEESSTTQGSSNRVETNIRESSLVPPDDSQDLFETQGTDEDLQASIFSPQQDGSRTLLTQDYFETQGTWTDKDSQESIFSSTLLTQDHLETQGTDKDSQASIFSSTLLTQDYFETQGTDKDPQASIFRPQEEEESDTLLQTQDFVDTQQAQTDFQDTTLGLEDHALNTDPVQTSLTLHDSRSSGVPNIGSMPDTTSDLSQPDPISQSELDPTMREVYGKILDLEELLHK